MKKAFTILELVSVIIILGILIVVALPKLSSSKNEAEINKALDSPRAFINDVSTYTLKNDEPANTRLLSNVSSMREMDLSRNLGDVAFRVGEGERCVESVFVQGASFVLMGLSANDNVRNVIKAVANGTDESSLGNADFTNRSLNKAYVALSKSENFKALANKTCLLLDTR